MFCQLIREVGFILLVGVFGFLVVLALVWLPIALPLYLWLGTTTSLSVVPLILLYGLFVVGLQIWGKRVHHHSNPLQAHGLVKSAQSLRELLTGIVIGVVSLGLLFGIEGWLGWLGHSPGAPSATPHYTRAAVRIGCYMPQDGII